MTSPHLCKRPHRRGRGSPRRCDHNRHWDRPDDRRTRDPHRAAIGEYALACVEVPADLLNNAIMEATDVLMDIEARRDANRIEVPDGCGCAEVGNVSANSTKRGRGE